MTSKTVKDYSDMADAALRTYIGEAVLRPIRLKLEEFLPQGDVSRIVENAMPYNITTGGNNNAERLSTERILSQIVNSIIRDDTIMQRIIGVKNSPVNNTSSSCAYVDTNETVSIVIRIGSSQAAIDYADAVGMTAREFGEDLLITYEIPSLEGFLDDVLHFIANYYFIMTRFPQCRALKVHFPNFLP